MALELSSLKLAKAFLVEHADELRAAGVTSMALGDFSVTFAPSAPKIDAPPDWIPPPEADPEPIDPLNDPVMYPGGVVPTFDRSDSTDD